MSQSITQRIGSFVGDAVDHHAQGEDIAWDIGSIIAPDGQLAHFVTIIGNSPILGETIQAGGMLVGAKDIQPEQVVQMVQGALEHIRQERSKALTRELPKSNVAAKELIVGAS